MYKMGTHVPRMTLEPRILSLQNPSNSDVATRALYKARRSSIRKIQLPAAQVALLPYKDWFETSLSAKFEIPLTP